MKRLSKWLFAAVVSTGIALQSASFATNGMFLIGYGTKSRGAGGVAIAMPQDAIAGGVNPATISFVKSRVDAGMDIFLPRAESELGVPAGGRLKVKSRADTFAMPAMGGLYNFNRKVTMGFSGIPYGGGGSRYNTNLYNAATGANAEKTLGVNLMLMQMNPTIAYKVNKQNSVGASIVFGVQTFRAFGLDYFENFTATGLGSTGLTNNGNDWAYGAGVRLGWMGQFMKKRLSLGAAYSSRVYMTEFDKYDELFAEQGDLDTPANVGVGVAYKFTPKLTIGLDVTHTFYEDVASIGNESAQLGADIFPDGEQNKLGLDDGLGFGWDNQTVFKLGAVFDYNKDWTFRAGWNYGESPIDEDNGEILMSIMAPATTQNHLTLGTTYKPTRNMELSFSYVHAFRYTQEGPTYIGGQHGGQIQMYQDSFGASFGYKL
jgi:long-chain fatty acid transport protein